ncbi:MAG: sialidase, partial [Bryobacteraceae bacterium]
TNWTGMIVPNGPAATALFQAATGPRVLPGAYTVKMSKNGQQYTAKLNVVLDPRAPYTLDERKEQFALVTKLAGLLNHTSWAVDAMIGLRDGAGAGAAKLPAADALRKSLESLAADMDTIRKKVVATKEGGAITGEERLREYLGSLYGDVNGYEGKPTAEQVARAGTLSRELDDVVNEFQTAVKRLPELNRALQAKGLAALAVISEADWQKTANE